MRVHESGGARRCCYYEEEVLRISNLKGYGAMSFFIILILVLGLAGMIGGQNVGLRKMENLQKSLDELNQKVEEIMNSKKY